MHKVEQHMKHGGPTSASRQEGNGPAHRARGLLLLAVGALGVASLPAQNPAPDGGFLWRSWDADHGLPSARINALATTSDGFLWIATPAGLVRFDGLEFTGFHASNTPALGDSRVLSLHVDAGGQLWAGTADGRLLRHEPSGWVRVALRGERATQGRSVLSLGSDREGHLWLGTDGAGLLRVSPQGDVEGYGPDHGLPTTTVSQVLLDTQGQCWVVCAGRLGRWTDREWTPVPLPDDSNSSVRWVASARAGGLWVAASSTGPLGIRGTRVYWWHDGTWSEPLTPYPWPQDSTRSRAQVIYEDRQGRVWCATAGGGVFVHQAGTGWIEASAGLSPAQLQVQCLTEDDQGMIWVGTRTLGLFQVRPRPVRALHLPPEFRPHVFLSTCTDEHGRIWGGTDGAGLFVWEAGHWRQIGPAQGLTSRYVPVLLLDRHGTLWVGTFSGLYRSSGDRFERVPHPPALTQSITALMEDRVGRIWAGAQGGLVCLDGDLSRTYGSESGLPLTPARALAEDGLGRIWAAIPGEGLFRQEGDVFEPAGFPDHPALRAIRSMTFDQEGRLWFVTLGYGLGCVEGGVVRTWTTSAGLPSDHQLALLRQGALLWIGSENGIFAVNPSMLLSPGTGPEGRLRLHRLTPQHGLAYKVCTGLGQPSAHVTSDGILSFPNGAAIARFHPEASLEQPRVWPPVLHGVWVDGMPLPMGSDNRLEIRSGAVSYEFQYSSPNLVAPERIRYRYQLEGLDRQPVEAGARRSAFYNRLPPGQYRFRLWASAGDTEWVEARTSLLLAILPRWWERRSVQLAGLLSVVGLISLGVWRWERNRSRRRMEHLRWQRAMDLERQRIARDIHDDLGSGLTEIILLSDTLREESSSQPAARRLAEEIAACARRLTRAMDEVVWAINPRHDSLESLLTYLNRFAQDHLNRAGIRCRWDVPLEVPALPLSAETRHHLYLACKEALHNVVKHAGASEVWVRFQMNGACFELSIEDNGRGFSPESAAKGNGLRHMDQRLSEIGGSCRIESQPGRGTRVVFRVVSPPRPRVGTSPEA